MGGRAGWFIQRTDEIAKAPTNAGGWQHIHQRTEEYRITVVAATAVIHGQLTLGMMLAVQYIIGQLNSPVEQLMSFFYSVQDVKISLERINEIHRMDDENGKQGLETSVTDETKGIDMENIKL